MNAWLGEDANPLTVPVGRLGGQMDDGRLWSASCFPVMVNGDVAVITPSHVLDGVATSKLLNIAHCNEVDGYDVWLARDEWHLADEIDIAVVRLEADCIRPWQVWSLEMPSWVGRPSGDLLTLSLPRLGAVESASHQASPASAATAELEWPEHEFLLDHGPSGGASGSPVFSKSDEGLRFEGVVTSAIQGDGPTQCAVLPSDKIIEFVMEKLG